MSDSIRKLELEALYAISQVFDMALDLEQALNSVLRILAETLSMKRATITLMDRETGQLVISASCGLSPEERARGVYNLDEGVTGRIFQSARPYYVPDIRNEPLFLDKTGARKIEKDRISFIGVPIILHGEPIGVLNVDRLFDDNVSSEEDVSFLRVVATLIAQFISINEKVRKREETLRRENVSLRSKLSKMDRGPFIVGVSHAMQEVQRQIEKVAPTKATVLLLGESGTGKSLIAKIIHELSDRKGYPFVKVNCAAIPENLLESELFGHERGAFTGAATSRGGRFEDAHKGTIFLDEIGELPLGVQAKLLRVLQDKEFERLGDNRTRRVDVRILTATNRNLVELVEQERFRPDLYYRLNVFPIQVPPLAERKEDVVRLLNHFLQKVSREYDRHLSFTPGAMKLLAAYNWPGNVREMENLVERLVILAEGSRIDTGMILPYLAVERKETEASAESAPPERSGNGGPTLQDMERTEVLAALRRNDWIQHKAAKDLGITQRQMGYRVRKYKLEGIIAEERARLRSPKSSGRDLRLS